VIRVEGHPVFAPVEVDRVPARPPPPPPPPPILGDGVATGGGPFSRPLPIAPRSATSPPPLPLPLPPPPPPPQFQTQNPHRTSPRSLPKLGISRPIRNDEPQRQCPYSVGRFCSPALGRRMGAAPPMVAMGHPTFVRMRYSFYFIGVECDAVHYKRGTP
jgi:hypothetical protein